LRKFIIYKDPVWVFTINLTIKNILFNIANTFSVVCIIVIFAGEASASDTKGGTNSLWSTDEMCLDNNALIIGIEELESSYKIALCSAGGCRVAVPGFGKKVQPYKHTNDPRFKWISNKSFIIQINGQDKQFYHCFTK